MILTKKSLTNIQVLDFSSFIPGPLAARLLADAGAQVTKIERPTGDPLTAPPFAGMDSPAYKWLNRDKTCQRLNLKDMAALKLLLTQICHTDIIIESYRPGVMDRLGLGYNKMKLLNPGLIYCAISGFGQTQSRPGHDLNFQAEAGLLHRSAGDGIIPLPSALLADIAAGSYPAVINILLALRQREQSGQGCYLDINITGNLQPFRECSRFSNTAQDKTWNLLEGASPRYQIYETRDAGKVAVAALEEHFWHLFTQAIGLDSSHLTLDPSLLIDIIGQRIRSQDQHYWQNRFLRLHACVSVVD
ncbi:MAG TPA: CoA transferase [Gammaproteobacteria bacterium]|nr:CoA transferase [Gammaproteobacteria bacterium]